MQKALLLENVSKWGTCNSAEKMAIIMVLQNSCWLLLFYICHVLVTLARDQTKELGYEREEYSQDGPGRPAELTEALLRYDMNKTYYLRG